MVEGLGSRCLCGPHSSNLIGNSLDLVGNRIVPISSGLEGVDRLEQSICDGHQSNKRCRLWNECRYHRKNSAHRSDGMLDLSEINLRCGRWGGGHWWPFW